MAIKKQIDRGLIEAKRVVPGIERSPKWPAVEKAHLKLQPNCVACDPAAHPNEGVQVHHIFPFHYCIVLGRPDLELDQRNLITLCEKDKDQYAEDHHILVGHLGDFKSSNLNVTDDAKITYYNLTQSQIKASKIWIAEKKKKLKALDKMTDLDKAKLKKLMDQTFPIH